MGFLLISNYIIYYLSCHRTVTLSVYLGQMFLLILQKFKTNNIMSIRHSSILLNTYIIHTHSYQGFIIIININIIIYHWYRLRYYFIYLI